MAITVEDGSIVASANSYGSEAAATAYHLERNNTDWAPLTSTQKVAALLYAANWLDRRYRWPGTLVDTDQTMSWPRIGVYDSEGRTVSSTAIPAVVQQAQFEAALSHVSEVLNVVRDRGGAVDYAKIDDIAVSFANNAQPGRSWKYIDDLVAPVAYPRSSGIITIA